MKKENILKTFLVILSVLVVILTVAVVVLSCLLCSKGKSEEDKNAQYYKMKCDSFAVQNFNLSKGQIVFIGDSITDLYKLDDYYGDLSLSVYNRGIGGDQTKGVLDRLKVSLYDIAPSKIVLMIGTNDINGNIETETIIERYEKIVDSIYENLPSVELYCMSIIPQNNQLETYSTINVEETTQKILEINPQIKSLVEERGATYIDLFSQLADENNHLIENFSDDGLHLNHNGFVVWTGILKPCLQ